MTASGATAISPATSTTWTFDLYKGTYNETTCIDCAFTYSPGETDRMMPGSRSGGDATDALVMKRTPSSAYRRGEGTGVRCARKP